MGHGRWSRTDWRDWAGRNTAGRSAAEIFTSQGLLPEYDPAHIRMPESRDGPDNAASTPIVLASDVTGSLGEVARILMQDKLGLLVSEILARKPVSDPHIMAMAVGDARRDMPGQAIAADRASVAEAATRFEPRLAVTCLDQFEGREVRWVEGGRFMLGSADALVARLAPLLPDAPASIESHGPTRATLRAVPLPA